MLYQVYGHKIVKLTTRLIDENAIYYMLLLLIPTTFQHFTFNLFFEYFLYVYRQVKKGTQFYTYTKIPSMAMVVRLSVYTLLTAVFTCFTYLFVHITQGKL